MVYAYQSVADSPIQRLAEGEKRMVVGPGTTPGVQVDPLIDENALNKVASLVSDAVAKGAVVHTGGHRLTAYPNGSFYAPTVLSGVTAGFRIVGRGQSQRIECGIPGADVNPYLAYSALLAAGLHGVESGLRLPDEFRGNAYVSGHALRVPHSLYEAMQT